jgi:hypothetical protein
MANPVVHFEIAGKDGEQIREFYAELFGWEFQILGGEMDYGLVAAAGKNSIGGGVCKAPMEVPPYLTFYVQVDDLATALARAEELGGRTTMPPTPIPDMGSCAMFCDPDGNLVGLYSTTKIVS